ncbi:MAG: glycoside hydrolase family 127 protein [Lachnospiraceae bacterium]
MEPKRWHDIFLKDIVITDDFWNHYKKLVKDVIIPYQWNVLNDREAGTKPSYCIHNFKVAAGEADGEIEGVVFLDSDLAKWLEAAAYSLETDPDPELMAAADEVIELIGRTQGEDGYLGTYFSVKEPGQRFLNLQEGHELYTTGHMIEAAVAYDQATGKTRLLEIVSRMADLLCETFGPEEQKLHGYPGHQEIELALVKLFRVTGVQKYLDLAKYFIDIRGCGENYFIGEERRGKKQIFPEFQDYQPVYSQSHQPVREQLTAEGHAVRAVYMYCAMADLAYEYQDETLLAACQRLWDNIVHKRMYITGGIGSSGILERFTTDYDLPNDRNYSETCASIGMAMFGKRMAQITRQASYMDIVELELYNNILAGIALDGKSFFYVNPLEVWPDNCISRTSMEHVEPVRQKWFGVACCPPNVARTLASIGQYMFFQDQDGICLNLYISSKVNACVGSTPVTLTINSQMPLQGRCDISLEADEEQSFMLALRIPSYARDFRIIRPDGERVPYKNKGGYAYIKVNSRCDPFTVSWEMSARYIRANPSVKADLGKTAVMRGPVVYCLEEIDNGSNLPGIFIDTGVAPQETLDKTLFGKTVCLTLTGKRIRPWEQQALYDEERPRLEEVAVKAIPYFLWNNRIPGEMLVWIKELL